MSYDVWLELPAAAAELERPELEWNYTSNCAPMWREAGADLATFDGRLAVDCLNELLLAIATMVAGLERFRAMNPPNGWGDADSLIERLAVLAKAFADAPDATVRVSR